MTNLELESRNTDSVRAYQITMRPQHNLIVGYFYGLVFFLHDIYTFSNCYLDCYTRLVETKIICDEY